MIYDAITNTTACILWITKCDEGILLEYQERSGNAIETNILFTDPDGVSSNALRKSVIIKNETDILSCLLQQGVYSDCPRPDLIILDLDLPEAGGFNVLDSIKSDLELKITPVIVFTSSKDETDIRKAYEYHANCYVIKSVDYDMFYRKIRAIENFWLNFAELPVKKTSA
jgi:two-component system, chemotaxis family, response regulator Rcp1